MADLSTLSDLDLARMTNSAWRDAARSWGEARAASGDLRQMLLTSAESADAYWRDLRDEQNHRLEEVAADIPTEVRSSDVYTVQPEGLRVLTPVRTAVEPLAADRITSPWVTKAAERSLPGKALRGGALRS